MNKISCSLLLVVCLMSSVLYSQEWPCWKGPNYDGKSPDIGLKTNWPAEGPQLLWKINDLGEGYSNLTFWENMIFTEGDLEGESYLLILNRADGKVIRKIKFAQGGVIRGYPGPKSTPATDGQYVYPLNQYGHLACIEIRSGKVLWTKSYQDDFEGQMMSSSRNEGMNWGYAESPLIDGEHMICSPGGDKGTFVALHKKTGETIWRCTALTDKAGYCSVTPVVIDGVRQYLVATGASVAGLNPANGELLWRAEFPAKTAVGCDPIYHEGIVFISAAYNVGAFAWNVKKEGEKFIVTPLYDSDKIDNKHHGLMRIGKDIYSSTERGTFVCVDMKTGEIQWEERKIRGKASVSFADGKLILRNESSGEIMLVEPNANQYSEIARFEQPDRSSKNAWTYPLIVDKKMYIRDQETLFCYDLSK